MSNNPILPGDRVEFLDGAGRGQSGVIIKRHENDVWLKVQTGFDGRKHPYETLIYPVDRCTVVYSPSSNDPGLDGGKGDAP